MTIKKILIIKIFGITILLFALSCFGYVKMSHFVAIDSCLDKGGHWNYTSEKCECSGSSAVKKSNLKQYDIKSHLIINNKCAVIYNPDNAKIYEAKKINEDDFYTSADDAMYYISKSRDFFKSRHIKIIETDSRIINFKVNHKLIKSIDLKTYDKFWGIILFDGKNMPVEIDMTDTEIEFDKYINEKNYR